MPNHSLNFSGRMHVIVTPAVHRKVFKLARANGESMVSFMARAISNEIKAQEAAK